MTRPEDISPDASQTDSAEDPKGLGLHGRLVAGDPSAIDELWFYYEGLYQAGMRKLMRPSPHNEDIAREYAYRSIIRLIETPSRFDPERNKSLFGYLRMDVEGDILNYLASSRYRVRIDSLDRPIGSSDDDVGEQTIGGNIAADDPSPDELVVASEGNETVTQIRQTVVKTDIEGIVFDLQYVHAEKATEVFAEALGLSDLAYARQVSEIQKIKDRLAKRLRRMREDLA